jgi:hypothetical protein
MLRRRYTRESATLLHVLGSRGDISTSLLKLLRACLLLDKVSTYKGRPTLSGDAQPTRQHAQICALQ